MTEPTLIPILPMSVPSSCSSCGQRIFWGVYPTTGRRHPVSMQHPNAKEPTIEMAGQGISHFIDCPNADLHRRKK